MNWSELWARAFAELRHVLRDDQTARMAAWICLGVLVSVTISTVVVARNRRRTVPEGHDAADVSVLPERDWGDWGRTVARARGAAYGGEAGWPIDSVLPKKMTWTVVLAIVLAVSLWLAGFALAPNIPAFLASREWQVQPLYFAAHVIITRLFVLAYTRGFERGVAHLAVPDSEVRSLVDRVLGFPGALLALVIALPFVAFDFLYLLSPRYERLGGSDAVLPIDYLMWGVWSVEWFLNAFIWVVLIGFLIKSSWVIRRYPFRAPVEIVLHDKHYKPFLQMSAQGATAMFVFTAVTVGYIWYTGGELTDYAGLTITAGLLFLGFLPPWLLLKAKVRRAVDDETSTMRQKLLKNLHLAEAEASASVLHGRQNAGGDLRSLEHRLDAAVAILRISYLEGRNQNLGQTEARAIMIRMLAPAASIGWQLAKTHGHLVTELQAYLARIIQ